MNITKYIARIICEMEEVCHSESQGPDNGKLMAWIGKTYPELKEEFSWFPWDFYGVEK